MSYYNMTDKERSARNNSRYDALVEADKEKASGNYVPPANIGLGIAFWVVFLGFLLFLMSKG